MTHLLPTSVGQLPCRNRGGASLCRPVPFRASDHGDLSVSLDRGVRYCSSERSNSDKRREVPAPHALQVRAPQRLAGQLGLSSVASTIGGPAPSLHCGAWRTLGAPSVRSRSRNSCVLTPQMGHQLARVRGGTRVGLVRLQSSTRLERPSHERNRTDIRGSTPIGSGSSLTSTTVTCCRLLVNGEHAGPGHRAFGNRTECVVEPRHVDWSMNNLRWHRQRQQPPHMQSARNRDPPERIRPDDERCRARCR